MDLASLLQSEESVRFVVEAAEAGSRLDAVVRARLRFASRARVQRWIAEGRATDAGGAALRASRRLREGEVIVVRPVKTRRDLDEDISALVEAVTLVHDGGDFGVIRKPPKVLAHPSGGTIKRTVLTAVGLRFAARIAPGGPWLPHRLDFETAGLELVAFTADAARRLAHGLETRAIARHYLARVRGRVPYDRAVLDAPLLVVPGRPSRVVVDAAGVAARTDVAVVARDEATTLLEVEPLTGRMHQIRVHLAHAGFPIMGDPLHDPGAGSEPRMRLLAVRLALPARIAGAPHDVVVRLDTAGGELP